MILLIKINYFLSEYDEQLNDNQPIQRDDFDFVPMPDLNFDEDFGGPDRPNIIIDIIFEVIKYAAITAIVAGLLYFFIKPFFTKHWRVFWFILQC